MRMLSAGKIRGLRQIANSKGRIMVCALDHRGSLQKVLRPDKPEGASYEEMVNFKLDLCDAVAPYASAILLDPIFGASQAITSGILPGGTGLLVSLEKTGYEGATEARITEILPDWGVKKIKRMGASAVKLLIYFRPDLGTVTATQMELVSRVADECLSHDIPLLLESVAYPSTKEAGNKEEFAKRRPELVIESARKLTTLPIDVLKTEFPSSVKYEKDTARMESYCRELTKASQRPWVLLSGGDDWEHFRLEAEIAFRSGASGFMAGRALWQESTTLTTREKRADFFRTETVRRLKEMVSLADRYAKPWYDGMGALGGKFGMPTEDWYKNY
jgi:tagatose 1,6-diphosphate aldolase